MAKVCIYCRSVIIKPSEKHDDLCVKCYMLVKMAEKEERLAYV